MNGPEAKVLENISKKLEIIIVILLARSGLTRKEIADTVRVSEKTIERMLPFGKIKKAAQLESENERVKS